MPSENVVIRGFQDSDAKEIVRLHKDSERFFEDMEMDEPFILSVSRRRDFDFLVAESEGSVVGFCGFLSFPLFGRAEIGPIAVDSRFRRRGVGGRLARSALGSLKSCGISRVIVKVKAGNVGAISFFSGMGFEREGLFRRFTKSGEDVVQCVLFLS